MDWQEEYKRKLVSADEAVSLVKSGDRVEISIFPTPSLLPPALHKRRAELRGVETVMPEPVYPMPWFEPGYEESFSSTLELHVGMGGARPVVDEKRADYYPILFSLWHKPYIDRPESAPPMDVFMCTVSPPDRNGYCSFGGHLWNKRVLASHAKIVLAEVDETFIRTHGTNYIHVSDIDRFVENRPELMPDDELERIIQDMPDEEGSRELRAVSTRVEVERRYDFIPKLALMDGPTIRGWAQVYGYQSENGANCPDHRQICCRTDTGWLVPAGRWRNAVDTYTGDGRVGREARPGGAFGDVGAGVSGTSAEGCGDWQAKEFSPGEIHRLGAYGLYPGRDTVYPQQP